MSSDSQEKSSKGIAGLTNIGNTCYGNATLQAIRHQVDFTIFILQGNHTELMKKKKTSEKTKLLQAYGELSRALWTAEGGVVKTRDFWSAMIPAAIKEGVGHFQSAAPHDAHEFLVFLLDQFHEALAEDVKMTIQKTVGQSKDVVGALDFWKKSFEKSYSPFVELLFGLLRKSVVCEGCKNESVTWETMNINKVCVTNSDKNLNLLDLMREECKEEIIDDYACDCCSKRVRAIKTLGYWRLGNWVIITLKRNENNGRKINKHIDIPKKICFQPLFHPKSEETSAKASYELFSTIEHHGSSRGGHYTAHAKHSVTGAWTLYDDESTMEVADVPINSSTYIVMYRKE